MKKNMTWLAAIIGILIVVRIVYKAFMDRADALYQKNKIMSDNKILVEWVENGIDSNYLEKYFTRRKQNKIAIYGTGTLGEIFYRTIKDAEIEIAYFIDKSLGGKDAEVDGIPVYDLSSVEELPPVDSIVITPVFYCEDIKDELEELEVPAKRIFSMEKIIESRSSFNMSSSVLGARKG